MTDTKTEPAQERDEREAEPAPRQPDVETATHERRERADIRPERR